MSFLGGGAKTTVSVPPPGPEETALTQLALDLAQGAGASLTDFTSAFSSLTGAISPSLGLSATSTDGALSFGLTPNEGQLLGLRDDLALSSLVNLPSGDAPNVSDTIADSLQRLIEAQAEAENRLQPRIDSVGNFTPDRIDAVLSELAGGAEPTENERELVTQLITNLIESGEADIDRVAERSLEQIREELAPSLGLSSSDTPNLDRGARVGEESVRSAGQLQNALRAEEARLLLARPLERLGLQLSGASSGDQLELNALGTALQGQAGLESLQLQSNLGILQGSTERDRLQEAARQFQQNLRQQATQFQLGLAQDSISNRLNLLNALAGGGTNLSNSGLGLAGTALSSLAQSRLASTTTEQDRSPGLGGLLSGAGGLLRGLGATGVTLSNSKFKEGITEVDDRESLEAVERIPVATWRYRGGAEPHIGPMAEKVAEVTGRGDGVTLNLADTSGLLLSAVKALAKEVRELKESPTLALAA